MAKLGLSLAAIAVSVTGSLAYAEGPVALVGIEDGQAVQMTLGSGEYRARLESALLALKDAMAPVIKAQSSAVNGPAPWKLRSVIIGVGVGAEAGFGPVLKLKAVPRFRLAFGDNGDPALP